MQNSKLKIQQEFYNNFLKSMPKDQIIRVRGAPQIENWTTSIYKIECLLLKQQSSSIDFNNVFVYNSLKLDCVLYMLIHYVILKKNSVVVLCKIQSI